MQVTPRIAVRGTFPEAAVAEIHERVAKLEQFFAGIVTCRVGIEGPGAHHRNGRHAVRIILTVPHTELVVTRQFGDDPMESVREAFDAMQRRLEDYVRRLRGDVKSNEALPIGRIARVFGDRDYGFIAVDGREIYFHRHSVTGARFEDLEPGMRVRFSEEEGEEGPQAAVVQLVGRSH